MDIKAVDEFIKEVNLLFGKKEGEITEDTRFREDLNATSLHYMGMAGTIGDLTGEDVSYAQIRGCATMGDAVALLKALA